MFYTIFIKKSKGDRGPFMLAQVVKNYANSYGRNDIVLSFPGYMSKNKHTINCFCNSISLPKGTTYFTYGMNGGVMLNSNNGELSIQDLHNKYFNTTNFNFPSTQKQDHSKMMFFIDAMNFDPQNFHSLYNCNVKALLIGSSNQSYNTYFANYADKGEADIFIINSNQVCCNDDDVISLVNKDLTDNHNEAKDIKWNCDKSNENDRKEVETKYIISKEISDTNNKSILNHILIEILNNNFVK